ncbi:transcriptional regulator, partial [Lactobacillus acidophilus]
SNNQQKPTDEPMGTKKATRKSWWHIF